jgi:DNA-binding PadR family transcriptional regulator/polyisoprenoid-binding protein YceI
LAPVAEGTSRFDLAPPRRFILPAVLLLLLEEPDVGYSLANRLLDLGLGHVDRPAVYRGLAQLEADGLAAGVAEHHGARPARRYHVTEAGERALRVWMGVIKEEHHQLGHVLRRYQATATGDAVLAEVEGGWAAEVGYGWSAVSSSCDGLHRAARFDAEADRDNTAAEWHAGDCPPHKLGRYRLVSDRSVVLIEVRSTAGPLSFGSVGVTGSITAAVGDGVVQPIPAPVAQIEIDVSGLRSGNRLYDAELLRRIDARRFPRAVVELRACERPSGGTLYHLDGALTFHGVTRPTDGTVSVDALSDQRLVVTGQQDFDIRDFAIPSPTVLMLRIYPDVRVRLHVEAELEEVL